MQKRSLTVSAVAAKAGSAGGRSRRGWQAARDPITAGSIRRRGPAGMARSPSRSATIPSDDTKSARKSSAHALA